MGMQQPAGPAGSGRRRRLEQIRSALGGAASTATAAGDSEVDTATAVAASPFAEVLRSLDASETLPAPHHTPLMTPEQARARQVTLARTGAGLGGKAGLLQLYEGMLRVEAFERTLEERCPFLLGSTGTPPPSGPTPSQPSATSLISRQLAVGETVILLALPRRLY